MFENTKNSMFDANEVRNAILSNKGLVPDVEKAIKFGNGMIPIGLVANIGTIEFKSDADKAASKNQPFSTTDRLPSKYLSIFAVMDKFTLYKASETPISAQDYIREFNGYNISSLAAPKDSIVMSFDSLLGRAYDEKGCDFDNIPESLENDKLKYYKYARAQVQELLKNILGTGWDLYISVSGVPTDSSIKTQIEYEIASIANNIYGFLTVYLKGKKKLNTLELVYMQANNALAINVIKLVEKGTDTKEFDYTGRIKGIVYEALVQINLGTKDNYNGEVVKIVKSLEKSPLMLMDNKLISMSLKSDFRSSVLKLADVPYPMAVITSMVGIRMDDENDLACTDAFSQVTSEKIMTKELSLGDIGSKEYELVFTNTTRGCSISPFSDTLSNLLIPYGYDLTNSFKAKYI